MHLVTFLKVAGAPERCNGKALTLLCQKIPGSNPDDATDISDSSLSVLSGWKDDISLLPVNQNDTSQSWFPLSSCMLMMAVSMSSKCAKKKHL